MTKPRANLHSPGKAALLLAAALLCAPPVAAAIVPSGTIIEARLSTPIASYSTQKGAPVEAVLVAPVRLDEATLLPIGTNLRGTVCEIHKVGLGIRRGRATVDIVFVRLELPDGSSVDLSARIRAVNNARETVDAQGRIQGIRATDAFGHKMAGITRNLFIWDPLIQVVLSGATMAVIRFPESEIYFPAGTEMQVELLEPVTVRDDWTVPLPRVAEGVERETLLDIVHDTTPFTTTAKSSKPADVVNLLFIGEPDWLGRAFEAAGWVEAHALSKRTGWNTFTSVAEARAYAEAPMSELLHDELPPDREMSKALNTYSKRHHLRLWRQPVEFRGRSVMAASATQDTAIDFSFKRMRLMHAIDPNIDNERSKVVNDLIFAGCVDAAELIDRPMVPKETVNGSGQKVSTDGRLLVVELNACRSPRALPTGGDDVRISGNAWQKIPRQVFLTVRNDFTRNNPVYQAVQGVKYLWNKAFRGGRQIEYPERTPAVAFQHRD